MDYIAQQDNNEQFLIKNYKLCPIHSQRLNLLKIDDYKNENLIKCLECLAVQPFKFVPLIKFLDSDYSDILKGWPILEDSQFYDHLKGMKQKDDHIMQEIQKVLNFFDKLKKEINKIIEKEEKDLVNDIQTKYDNLEYPIDLYNKISSKVELKDIILNSYQNQEKQDELFSQIIKQNLENQEIYKQKMLESLENYNKNSISYEKFFTIQEKIIQFVKQMNFGQTQIKIDSLENLNQIYEQQIVDIELEENNIQEEGAKQIAEALKKLNNITNLALYLYNCNIQMNGTKEIASALQKLNNVTNLTLNLRENNIQVEGAKQIASAIQRFTNMTNLSLYLNNCNIQTNGVIEIALALQKLNNIANLNLEFSQNNIEDEGAKQIALALEQNHNITEILLGFYKNNIKAEGAKQIALALMKCKNIKVLKLYLGQNSIQEEGAKQIASTLESLPNMANLILMLTSNNIGTQGADQIIAALQRCVNITNLTLGLKQNNLSIYLQNKIRQLIQNSLTKANVIIDT
ncbi:hypothetical protein ABPG74_019871 [Tetrahymena malaccensis]